MNQLAKKLLLALACVALIVGAPACCRKCKKTCTTRTSTPNKEVMMDDTMDNGAAMDDMFEGDYMPESEEMPME